MKIKGIRGSGTGYRKYRARAAEDLFRARELFGELLFPARCPVCNELIDTDKRMAYALGKIPESADIYACEKCIEEFDFVEEPFCAKCGKQLFLPTIDGLCGDCAKKERSFISQKVLMAYDEPAQEVLMGLKYRGRKESGRLLGLLAAARLGDFIEEKEIDFLVPVPVHDERRRERGYNQAGVIADAIGSALDIPVSGRLLKRTKKTSAQKELSAEKRLENLLDAFSADVDIASKLKELCGGNSPKILLVDDIFTTGATVEACSGALERVGITSVYSLSIAAGADVLREERLAENAGNTIASA